MEIIEKYLETVVKKQKFWLILITLAILIIPLFTSLILGKSLFSDPESYYHLNEAKNFNWRNLEYFPLTLALKLLPFNFLIIIPLVLACLSILLLRQLFEENKLPPEMSFLFLVFTIISPTFILSFSNFTQSSYFIFLLVFGLYLLSRNRITLRIIGILPLLIITFLNGFSSVLLILILTIYFWAFKRLNKQLIYLLTLIFLSFIFNMVFLRKDFFMTTLTNNQHLTNLIAALGGTSGISFLVILLALVGLVVTWRKSYFYKSYLFLPLFAVAYFYNNRAIFLLSLIINFFASIGFLKIFQRPWILQEIKKYTFLLIILGLLFTTISYLDRSSSSGPLAGDKEVLTWIKDNTLSDAIIFSDPVDSQPVKFFSDRPVFYLIYKDRSYSERLSEEIFSATYISDYQKIASDSRISLFYITPRLREKLPSEQGLLFLLRSETFKLVHSSNGFEVWAYNGNN